MQRARANEDSQTSGPGRGAERSASRPTPLTLVAGAIAGDELPRVAMTVAEALSRPVAIAIPSLGVTVVAPPDAVSDDDSEAILAHAAATVAGHPAVVPAVIAEAVAVQIGERVVGIVAAGRTADEAGSTAEQRPWLEAAAAAASVAALIHENHRPRSPGGADSPQALLSELAAGAPDDLTSFLARARRLGHELNFGAIAICAWRLDHGTEPTAPVPTAPVPTAPVPTAPVPTASVPAEPVSAEPITAGITAARPGGRVLALAPLALGEHAGDLLAEQLRADGYELCQSAPRRNPALLHQAVMEAELLADLAEPTPRARHDETYRLLIGVLLRDRVELEALRDSTITPLADYDARHDTELLATLGAFLTHDGSTTETAEAMELHRHTVGYRLSRVHEVSGLSPYETDGRERLSLGIKAQRILEAAVRRR